MKKLVICALIAMVAGGASGDNWIGGTGSWTNGANWHTGTKPDPADPAYINNGGTAQLDTVETVATLALGLSGTGGELQILPGGQLTTTGADNLGQGSGWGTLTINGGTFIHSSTTKDCWFAFDAVPSTLNLYDGVYEAHFNTRNNNTGTFTVNITGGRLTVCQFNLSTNLTIGGTAALSPGGDGGTGRSYIYQFSAAHSLSFTDNSTLRIDIGGTTQGTLAWTPSAAEYDYVRVERAANLDGDLDIHLVGGFTPAPSDSFTILTASTLNGTKFDNTTAGSRIVTADGAGRFDVTYNATTVVLSNYEPLVSHWENVSGSIWHWTNWPAASHQRVYIGGGGDDNWITFDDGTTVNEFRQQWQYLDLYAALETSAHVPAQALLKWTGTRSGGNVDVAYSWFAMPAGSTDMGRTEIIAYNGAGRDGNEVPDYYDGNTGYGSIVVNGSGESVSWDITDLVQGWYNDSIPNKGEMLLLWDRLSCYHTWGSSGPTLEFFIPPPRGTVIIVW